MSVKLYTVGPVSPDTIEIRGDRLEGWRRAKGGMAMSAVDDFKSKFDEEGRFRGRDGTLSVVFATKGGGRFLGKLHFSNGLCVRAEMEGGGDWVHPDNSPIHGIRFLFDFGGKGLHGAAIDQGRVVRVDEARRSLAKRDFLANFRIARNLFVHSRPVDADRSIVNITAFADTFARAAIWLTPKSVAGFNAADFPDLGPVRQAELQTAVQNFLAVATQVPADKPATKEQYGNASLSFARILEILAPYLPVPDEAEQVEAALRSVDFPPWVVNWDYELASDSDGTSAVWVNVFADEQALPKTQLGRAASELTSKARQALDRHQIRRWPYIRLTTALEHKVGC